MTANAPLRLMKKIAPHNRVGEIIFFLKVISFCALVLVILMHLLYFL